MRNAILEKLSEHLPDAFEALDQKFAKELGLTTETFKDIMELFEYKSDNGHWPSVKMKKFSPCMCESLVEDILGIKIEKASDTWIDNSYPGNPIEFCAYEISAKNLRRIFLKSVINLYGDIDEKEGKRDNSH